MATPIPAKAVLEFTPRPRTLPTDYYRQGSRLVGDADSATLASLFIAGGIGFGIGWLVFGQHSRSGDYVARRMSHSSERDH